MLFLMVIIICVQFKAYYREPMIGFHELIIDALHHSFILYPLTIYKWCVKMDSRVHTYVWVAIINLVMTGELVGYVEDLLH